MFGNTRVIKYRLQPEMCVSVSELDIRLVLAEDYLF